MSDTTAFWLLFSLGLLYAKNKSSDEVIDPNTGIDISTHPDDPAASINRNVESPFAPGYDPLADPTRPSVSDSDTGNYVDDLFSGMIVKVPANEQATSAYPTSAVAAAVVQDLSSYNALSNPFEDQGGAYPREQGGVWVMNPSDVERLRIAWYNLHQGFAY